MTEELEESSGSEGEDWVEPIVMIVFEESDFAKAADYVAKSAQSPFTIHCVASVFVQESIRESFIKKVSCQFKQLERDVYENNVFKTTKRSLNELHAITILAKPDIATKDVSPTIVCDYTQSFLGSGPTGIITLNTFRTVKEALKLCSLDSTPFDRATIWCENLSCAYEVAIKLSTDKYFINCINVSLAPIYEELALRRPFVSVVNNHHYEIVLFKTKLRLIVFPTRSIIDKDLTVCHL